MHSPSEQHSKRIIVYNSLILTLHEPLFMKTTNIGDIVQASHIYPHSRTLLYLSNLTANKLAVMLGQKVKSGSFGSKNRGQPVARGTQRRQDWQ